MANVGTSTKKRGVWTLLGLIPLLAAVYWLTRRDAAEDVEIAIHDASGNLPTVTTMTGPFSSSNGGGIKGSFTAGVLAALEKDTGNRCVDHFDLIAGTSTGGIIPLGLGLGLAAAEIVDFYSKHGPTIFPSTSLARRWSGVLRHLFQPKHSHQALRAALMEVFGERKFGESLRPLVIPTYDAVGGRIFLLKTAYHEHLRYDYDAPAAEVALNTAAAPTYFAAARFPNHGNNSYVD